jgi:hypothetical protein
LRDWARRQARVDGPGFRLARHGEEQGGQVRNRKHGEPVPDREQVVVLGPAAGAARQVAVKPVKLSRLEGAGNAGADVAPPLRA